MRDADALSVSGNFLAECGSCVELAGSGQASKVTDNLIGAGYVGFSIFAEGHMGLLVTGNNVFPRGKSSVHFKDCTRSSITSNRFHAFYPGMVNFEGSCTENLVGANHFLRQMEPFDPLKPYNNGLDDLFGLVHIAGSNNTVTETTSASTWPPGPSHRQGRRPPSSWWLPETTTTSPPTTRWPQWPSRLWSAGLNFLWKSEAPPRESNH